MATRCADYGSTATEWFPMVLNTNLQREGEENRQLREKNSQLKYSE